jgi:hypothetical protein
MPHIARMLPGKTGQLPAIEATGQPVALGTEQNTL